MQEKHLHLRHNNVVNLDSTLKIWDVNKRLTRRNAMKKQLKYAVFVGVAMMLFVTGQPGYATSPISVDQPAILAELDSNVMDILEDVDANMIRGESLYVMFQVNFKEINTMTRLATVAKNANPSFFCSTSDILPAKVTSKPSPSEWRYGNWGGMGWTNQGNPVDKMDSLFQTHDGTYDQSTNSYAAAKAKSTASIVNAQKAYDASFASANTTYNNAVASAKGNRAKIASALAAKTSAITSAAVAKTVAITIATTAWGIAYTTSTLQRTLADSRLEYNLTSGLPLTYNSYWGRIYLSESTTDAIPRKNVSVYMGVNTGTGSYRAMVVSEYAHRQARVAFKYPAINIFRNAVTP
jgi:hypothetical protein